MVVCNSGPLIHLSRIGKIDLLRYLFGSVKISDSTYREVVEDGLALRKAGVSTIEHAIEDKWIEIVKLSPRDMEQVARLTRSESLDEGDAKCIVLAQRSRTGLITNDRFIVRSARALGVECLWTTSLLLKGVKERKLTSSEALSTLRRLAETGLHLRLDVYESLRTAIEDVG